MYKILQPFAPMIYHGQCSEEFLKFLQDSLDPTWEEGENMSHVLAGNMEKQFKMVSDPATFVEYIYPHVLNYVRACHERYNEYVLEPDQYDVSKSEGVTAVKFDFPAAPWINFQHKHEFNPIHMHCGALSAVIMIDIPIEIEESFRESQGKTNMPAAGLLEFVYGIGGWLHSGSHKVIPKTGDFFIFPANLKHGVYPFTVDVQRVSMSFNLIDVEVQ